MRDGKLLTTTLNNWRSTMFDKDFYPTPKSLIYKMADKVNWRNVTYALEPSAGKGDIVDHFTKPPLSHRGGRQYWELVEKNNELRSILFGKGYTVTGEDFLSYQTNTEYDLILANPPFSEGVKHLLKMIELAEKQVYSDCQIICLLNAETLKNDFSNSRKHLGTLLQKYDAEVEYLEDTFANAERTTQVEVALVTLTVNKSKRSKDYFEDVLNKCNQERTEEFSLALPTTDLGYKEEEIKRLISLYNEHVKRFKAFFNALGDLSSYSKYVEDDTDLTTRNKLVDFNLSYNAELQKLRIAYWEKMLKTDQFRELLTSSAYADLMKKITALADMEPTLENVYTMLVSLSQNNKAILTSALEELFDKFTSYHQEEFSKNIHYYNGWKTNDAFKMNKKVITPIGGSLGWLRWERNGYQNVDYQVRERIEDVLKVVQLVSKVPPGEWQQLGDYEFENDLIRFKVFKKGTLHIWFKDLKALDKLNFIVGQEKNWLPTDDEIKTDDDAAKYVKKHFPNMDMEQLSYQ